MPSPRAVFEIAHNAFLSLDGQGRVVYANPQAERLLGFEPGELVGVDFARERVVDAQRELVREALHALTSGVEDRDVAVGEDETLLMYTDGVTDTRGERDRFGGRRLRRVLRENVGTSPDELLDRLEAALDRFQVEGHSDDTGAVALRPLGVGAPTGGRPRGDRVADAQLPAA
jgi:PAS domain-containing protein